MYAPSNGIYWLASPSSYSYEGIICAIDSEPVNLHAVRWGYGAWQVSECDYGLCPVVSLKSTFKPTLVAD